MAKEKCDRNCATCGAENRSFCAVQMAMANQEILLALTKQVSDLTTAFAKSTKKETELIPPVCATDNSEPTDSGAETIND